MDRLYFLAREGAKIKLVYDRWVEAFGDGPPSEYLVLSRRTTTVPAINSREDILQHRPDESMTPTPPDVSWKNGLDWNSPRNAGTRSTGSIGWSPKRQVAVGHGQIGHNVLQLLDAVQDDIFAQAAAERPALQAYLRKMGFENGERTAIVDIGYSATVQDRVSLFTSKPVHGYYMMTIARAHAVSGPPREHRARVFCRRGGQQPRQFPAIYEKSFVIGEAAELQRWSDCAVRPARGWTTVGRP